jgi:hypothetical protein
MRHIRTEPNPNSICRVIHPPLPLHRQSRSTTLKAHRGLKENKQVHPALRRYEGDTEERRRKKKERKKERKKHRALTGAHQNSENRRRGPAPMNSHLSTVHAPLLSRSALLSHLLTRIVQATLIHRTEKPERARCNRIPSFPYLQTQSGSTVITLNLL